jgi:hypothetical protein
MSVIRKTQQDDGFAIMAILERQQGSRRMGLPVESPLIDSDGKLIERNRRQIPDRRRPDPDRKGYKVKLSVVGSD